MAAVHRKVGQARRFVKRDKREIAAGAIGAGTAKAAPILLRAMRHPVGRLAQSYGAVRLIVAAGRQPAKIAEWAQHRRHLRLAARVYRKATPDPHTGFYVSHRGALLPHPTAEVMHLARRGTLPERTLKLARRYPKTAAVVGATSVAGGIGALAYRRRRRRAA